LISVDLDHYIIDINMSTLKVFQLEMKQVIDVQLEHAFIDYPEISTLFEEKNLHQIEFYYDGVLHSFEPSLSKVRDRATDEVVGLRLQMRDVTERSSFLDEITVNALRDPLTNLYMKSSFAELGEKLCDYAGRKGQSLALILIDIDDFKMVNRKYSHLVGDQALVQLVEIVNGIIRSSDLFGRWESDDLILVLPKADEFSAYQICTRIKEKVSSYRFLFNNQDISLTVSLGYTILEAGKSSELMGLMAIAQQALAQSHALGRNRLTFLPMDTILEEE
jgi:diguanylate cyclase (GGDEF)-like protein